MNENNELLLHLAKNAEMGVSSTIKLLNTLKNKENKIKPLLENELKEYEYFKKKTEKLLKKNKVDVPSTNIFAKISSDLGIKMETIKDNSDSAIGSMLIEGMTMGITSITSKIKVYQESTQKNILKLAKEYVEFQEKEIDKTNEKKVLHYSIPA